MPSSRRVRMRVQAGPGKGLLLEVNPRWEHCFLEGVYELEVQNLIERFCRPGVTFFDVGSNFGYHSMLAMRYGAQAFAFEPDSTIADNLLLHTKLNGFRDRIRLERLAVFSHSGEILLHPVDDRTPHGNAHVYAPESTVAGAVRARCITLDDFAASNPAPGIVKIDVEGAESEVLKGAERIFQSHRPLLICEVHDAENEEFILAWLGEKYYGMRWLEPTQDFPRQLFAWPFERKELAAPIQAASNHQLA